MEQAASRPVAGPCPAPPWASLHERSVARQTRLTLLLTLSRYETCYPLPGAVGAHAAQRQAAPTSPTRTRHHLNIRQAELAGAVGSARGTYCTLGRPVRFGSSYLACRVAGSNPHSAPSSALGCPAQYTFSCSWNHLPTTQAKHHSWST